MKDRSQIKNDNNTVYQSVQGKSTVSTMQTIRLFFPFFLDFIKNVTAYTLDAAIIQPCKKSNYPIKVYLPRAKVSGSWPAILEFQASSRNLSCNHVIKFTMPCTQVSAQPDWSGKKDGDCENFWKFSSLEKIAYLILRAFNLRPGWISGKVYQITYKIKDFPSSHVCTRISLPRRRSILTASSHVQANMEGSSDIDFVLKIFAKSLSCVVTPFVRNSHGKSGGGFVRHLDRKII